jgi:hypothetical protein
MLKLNFVLVGCIVCGLSTIEFLASLRFDQPAHAQRSIFGDNIPPFHSNEGPVPIPEDSVPESSSSVPGVEIPVPLRPTQDSPRAKPVVVSKPPLRLSGQSNSIFTNPNFYPRKDVLFK